MSEPKEPNFFSDDSIYAKGVNWYSQLFDGAQASDILGEASTHYTKWPDKPNSVVRMEQLLPDVKLIYVIRHPVHRLISHYVHLWSEGRVHKNINIAINETPELTHYSLYSKQLAPYLESYGRENILLVSYESFATKPEQELARIARFIGYKKVFKFANNENSQNVSSKRVRKFPGYGFLIDSRIMSKLRRILVPKAIRNRIRQSLALQKRPELSEQSFKRLKILFDQDLAELSNKINLNLSCDNFKQQLTTSPIQWK